MKSFHVIHTITSPYRIHMFNIMDEILKSRGVKFHVHFMSNNTSHRPNDWSHSSQKIYFNHSFWPDIGPNLYGNKWHANPGLIKHILKTNIDYLLVGGPWASLTTILCSFSSKVKTSKIAWLEGNSETVNKNQSRTFPIKRLVLGQFDKWAVPGFRSEEYIKLILGKAFSPQNTLILPNIIDETKFDLNAISDNLTDCFENPNKIVFPQTVKTALIPARLIPEKGILEFFEHINPEMINGWQIMIVGEGPLKKDILELLTKQRLNAQVKLIAPIDYKLMPVLYNQSDLFIIPSVKDNNPLTLIEAMHARLPVLASTKIGNYPEAVQHSINGWGLNPFDSESIRKSITLAFGSSKEKLKSMGKKSKTIATSNWTSREVIANFLDAAI